MEYLCGASSVFYFRLHPVHTRCGVRGVRGPFCINSFLVVSFDWFFSTRKDVRMRDMIGVFYSLHRIPHTNFYLLLLIFENNRAFVENQWSDNQPGTIDMTGVRFLYGMREA